jgi:hypothetical protein
MVIVFLFLLKRCDSMDHQPWSNQP